MEEKSDYIFSFLFIRILADCKTIEDALEFKIEAMETEAWVTKLRCVSLIEKEPGDNHGYCIASI